MARKSGSQQLNVAVRIDGRRQRFAKWSAKVLHKLKPDARIKLRRIERLFLYNKSNGRCAYCGEPLTPENMTVDHIVPLSRGGTNRVNNMQIACAECNSLKGAMTEGELYVYI